MIEPFRLFSIRPVFALSVDANPEAPHVDSLLTFEILDGSFPNGKELGWHSSISMAKSGALDTRHCSRTSACRCLRRIVYDESACASRDNEGRGDDVATMTSDMLKSHNVGSTSSRS